MGLPPPPLANLREEFFRVIKPNGAVALFGSGKFTIELGAVFKEYFKYKFVWAKQTVSGFINCKYRPLTSHEDILIFSKGTAAPRASNNMTYNPQGLVLINERRGNGNRKFGTISGKRPCNAKYENYICEYGNYPRDVLYFNALHTTGKFHTSQKPVDLLEYLIRTYTNENEVVLDATIGSGSTAVACVNTNRHFIGFETEEKFYKIALERVAKARSEKEMKLL